MEVKIKKVHADAVTPKYGRPGDGGLDITAVSITYEENCISYGTGLAFEIPEGYVGLLFPRSSVYKTNQLLSNCVGVLDAGFRGELTFKFKYLQGIGRVYEVGDRVGQIIIIPFPKIEFVESEELSETERGLHGHGSTGR